MKENQFIKHIEDIVINVLKENNMLMGQWHLGTVDTVTSSTKLNVFVDGDSTSQSVGCNPNITFATGDHVWVIFINGNARDKFVICKRAI